MGNSRKCIVVVTGGSKGIGRSICRSFASKKSLVYFSYHSDKKAAQKTEKYINKEGVETFYKQVDVASFEEVKTFFDFVLEKSGHIDVLVNNAGTTSDGLLVRMKEETWNQVIDVNLKGTFNCTKVASRIMLKQKYGRIINITSIVGITGNSGQSNYAASKAGVIALTKTAALELASRNITVNAVAPGYIETSMTKKAGNSSKYIKKIPLGYAGKPDDISNVVCFLASKNASYITGQVINVNGGMYM